MQSQSFARIVFALVLAIQVGCVEAVRQNLVPTWTPYLSIFGTVLLAFTTSVKAESQ